VPAKAFAFLAAPHLGVQSFVRSLENTGEAVPGLSRQLQRLGVTGPDGLANHLTGDLVIEGGAAGSATGAPGAAVLLGTNNEVAMRSSLNRLASRLMPQMFGSSSMVTTSSGRLKIVHKTPTVRWSTVTNNGVTVRYVSSPIPAGTVQPAYAVTNGMGIVGTSPEAVESVIETRYSGPSIATAPSFVAAISHGSTQGDVVYVDFQPVWGMIGSQNISGNLTPLRTLLVTGHQTPDLMTERVFLSIG
jgi:hypothetical protein